MFFAIGKIAPDSFNIMSLINENTIKFFWLSRYLFFSLYCSLEIDLFDTVSCFKILMTHCSFYIFSYGTSSLSETLLFLAQIC